MSKNRSFVCALLILALFAGGCASAGKKRPMLYSDSYNNIPADIPSQFLDRYNRFVNGKERKIFKKLLTDEERQAFIDKFWLDRDPDPTTPENEEKQRIDQLIDSIADEPFFTAPGTPGLTFRSNGGFWGDMAHVYLLHGEPNTMDTVEGNLFVPLMLWLYLDPERGDILYAFLFYQKGGGGGSFRLFSQDAYQLDRCAAIYEVATLRSYNYSLVGGARDCPEDLYQVYNAIFNARGRGGIIDGRFFTWALFNFSMDPGLRLGEVLEPPKPASEIAKRSGSGVRGEAPKLTGTAGVDYILASCNECNSFIPGELHFDKEFTLTVRRGDIDWRVVDGKSTSVLKIKIVIESVTGQMSPTFFDRWATLVSSNNLIVSDPTGRRVIPLLTADEVAQIPVGTYWVSVYVKNTTPALMTKKYNAWFEKITK